MFKLVHYVVDTAVGKWAVGIQLKCLIVFTTYPGACKRFSPNVDLQQRLIPFIRLGN